MCEYWCAAVLAEATNYVLVTHVLLAYHSLNTQLPLSYLLLTCCYKLTKLLPDYSTLAALLVGEARRELGRDPRLVHEVT